MGPVPALAVGWVSAIVILVGLLAGKYPQMLFPEARGLSWPMLSQQSVVASSTECMSVGLTATASSRLQGKHIPECSYAKHPR